MGLKWKFNILVLSLHLTAFVSVTGVSRWTRSLRLSRRVITVGGSSIVRKKPGDWSVACNSLEDDPYIQMELITPGEDLNDIYSDGAVLKMSCTPGFGVNLPNDTIKCIHGDWHPSIPRCEPLPCRVPYIIHGSFYDGSKSLYFQEIIRQFKVIELRCRKGYTLAGTDTLSCFYGEWDVSDPPECVPVLLPSNDLFTQNKKPCGKPPNVRGAIVYAEGKPVDFDYDFRCGVSQARGKARWKRICENGNWTESTAAVATTCDGEIAPQTLHGLLKLINSTCTHHKIEQNVVTFNNNQEQTKEYAEFPTGTMLISRCVDIGKFVMTGGVRRKCVSGQWLGVTPKCEGLSQLNDYALNKPPTILFYFHNGSIVQTNDGKLLVHPGTTLHMDCLWIRKFGSPKWKKTKTGNTGREYEEGWADDIPPGREASLEYRLTIDDAQNEDSGIYTCTTPGRYSHQINVIVQSIQCPSLPAHNDLEYSTTETIVGTTVAFTCRSRNARVGTQMLTCTASGNWSASLPRCETN